MKLSPFFLVFCLLITNVELRANGRPFFLQRLGRGCYGFLAQIGVLADPGKSRQYRDLTKELVEKLSSAYEKRGPQSEDARNQAVSRLLTNIGFNSSLVDRWIAHDPEFAERILLNSNNRPVHGYHGVRVDPERYDPMHKGWRNLDGNFKAIATNHLFALKERKTKWFTRGAEPPEIVILEKYEVPNFGWRWVEAIPVPGKLTWWPAVTFTSEPSLFTSHFKFPEFSDTWYEYDQVIIGDKLVLPVEIQNAISEDRAISAGLR